MVSTGLLSRAYFCLPCSHGFYRIKADGEPVVLQTEVLNQPIRDDLAGPVTRAEIPLVSEPVSLDDENMPCLPPKGSSNRDQRWTRTKGDVQEAHKH